ncbi:FAD-dependent oxidoreductase [Desulfococcaceae bacterium HSG7]|nr:FAD-dependent oxidoreductase [Desulfococcaceae bacterium HSG7]
MTEQLPSHAKVVIIGGGVVGCATAYHLTKLGVKDVVVLERKELTCGTTWAAAGLVVQLRGTPEMVKMTRHGYELYQEIEKDTGQPTGFVKSGVINIATNEHRKHELEMLESLSESFGIVNNPIDMDELRKRWPLINTEDILSAYYMPDDGVVNPVDTAMSMAIGARKGGALIFEDTVVLDFEMKNDQVVGIKTDKGDIKCESTVLCAGMWSRELGRKLGISVPIHACQHMHFVTLPIEGAYRGMPILRDQDGCLYFREEVGGLLIGAFEYGAIPYGTKGIPDDWSFRELPDDMDHLEPLMENAINRVPELANAEIRRITTTAEGFTPDNMYIMGEAPGMKKLYTACGMNSSGILCGAGVGKKTAEWIVEGYPKSGHIWEADNRRCFSWMMNTQWLKDRAPETPGNLYGIHFPFKQFETGRNVRMSPFHDRLAERGACFGQLFGYERANWFAPEGVEPEYEYSFFRQNWFDYSAAEHKAIREGVGIYDLSSMANFIMQGKDALSILQNICGNDIDAPIGKVVYTQMLNDRGGIEADITVTKLKQDKFFIVTAGATALREFDYIERAIPEDAHAFLIDVSSAYAMLGVMGPDARRLLEKVTDADLSNEAFPYGTAKEIHVGYATPLAVRMSFVGELGWELYVPCEFAAGMFDALMEAGKDLNVKPVGLHAVDSLRLERGFKHWPSDIDPAHTPLEAGLGFAVKFDKGDFSGKEALLKQKQEGLKRKLVMFTIDDPEPLIYHDEPIYKDGQLVTENTHGAYGHSLGASVGMCYLESPEGISDQWITAGKYEIGVNGKRYPITIHLTAPYDPKGKRARM